MSGEDFAVTAGLDFVEIPLAVGWVEESFVVKCFVQEGKHFVEIPLAVG